MLDGFATFDLTMLGSTEQYPRRQLWKNVVQKMKDGNMTSKYAGEEEKLMSLKSGLKWIEMIDTEWHEIYGALYEESSSFPVSASETTKIEKDVHRTFGLFTKNIPFLRSVNISQECSQEH